jgi:hypothetical protein
MMMKGPFRELFPVGAQKVTIQLPSGSTVNNIKLLVSNSSPEYDYKNGILNLTVPEILDHEVIAVNLT